MWFRNPNIKNKESVGFTKIQSNSIISGVSNVANYKSVVNVLLQDDSYNSITRIPTSIIEHESTALIGF